MKLKSVTGVGHRPTTVYFIDVEGRQIEVEKNVYDKIMRSLSNGSIWVFDEEKQRFLKYGTQINLFKKLEEEE